MSSSLPPQCQSISGIFGSKIFLLKLNHLKKLLNLHQNHLQEAWQNKNWQQLEHVLRYLTTNVVQKKKSNGHLQSHSLCTRVCLSSRKCTLVRRKGCVLPKNTAITWPRRANTSASSAPTSVAARPSRAMSWPSISPSSTSSGLYSLEKEGVYSTQNKHR